MAIRIGILGYGNLAKGVELAIRQNPDMELAVVFTRRDPSSVKTLTEGVAVASTNDAADWKDKIDVLVICGGSATDLPTQTPAFASMFNVIDSFDTHAGSFSKQSRSSHLRRLGSRNVLHQPSLRQLHPS